jgi:hypothetical protein
MIDRAELDRRLAEADRDRKQLRRATLELREMGQRILSDQEGQRDIGPLRPDRRSPGSR